MKRHPLSFFRLLLIFVVLVTATLTILYVVDSSSETVIYGPSSSSIAPTTPAAYPTPTPRLVSVLTGSVTFEMCGLQLDRLPFQVALPPGWQEIAITDRDWFSNYHFTGPEGYINVGCGDGLGGGCNPENRSQVEIDGQQITNCMGKNGNKVWLGATFLHPEPSLDSSPGFSFTAEVTDETLLRTFLRSFKLL